MGDHNYIKQKDIKKSLKQCEEQYKLLTEKINDLIIESDVEGQILFVSPNYKDFFGNIYDNLSSSNIHNFIYEEDKQKFSDNLKNILAEEHLYLRHISLRLTNIKGDIKWFKCKGSIYKTINEEKRLLFIFNNINELCQYEKKIKDQAFYDSLTGLANRRLFFDRLELELAHTRREASRLAVLFLDLDRFKLINDTLGHGVGDQLLKQVAQRIVGCVREVDTVARLGGDEFTALLPNINSEENAAKVAERILYAMRQTLKAGEHELYLSTSIGVAIYPNDGNDADSLLKNSDAAMYLAKEKGRNNYKLYDPAMNQRALERLQIENSLRRALESRELVLFYQPKYNIDTRQIAGVEALLRWQHPERGVVGPGEFIPVAEDTGLILPIGEWVLRTACAQNKAWQDMGFPPVKVAVNISPKQFQLTNLVEVISETLEETKLAPEWLELEITESVAMNNGEHTINVLERLSKMGIQISIDDFGTGYSSLSYLNRFPINKLKIDRSFIKNIKNIKNDNQDTIIASTMILLGKNLNLSVVAEGVETEEQYAFLKEHNCSEMQGFLFSKPLPAESIVHIF